MVMSAHGVLGRQIDPSWSIFSAISHSNQCSTTGVTNALVGLICQWDGAYIRKVLLIGKSSVSSGSKWNPLSLSCPLPYIRHHISFLSSLPNVALV